MLLFNPTYNCITTSLFNLLTGKKHTTELSIRRAKFEAPIQEILKCRDSKKLDLFTWVKILGQKIPHFYNGTKMGQK